MVVDNQFEFKQIVYLKTDREQLPRIVTMMQLDCLGQVSYQLSQGTAVSWHLDFEITTEKDLELSM